MENLVDRFLNYVLSPQCQALINAGKLPQHCIKQAALNGVNIGVVMGAMIVKLPQIFKVVSSQSVAGLSEPSLVIELLSATCACLYAKLQGHPFASWGEMFFVSVQCLMLNMLFWRYSHVSLTRRFTGVLIYFTTIYYTLINGLPSSYIAILGSLPFTLNLLARIPQIALNFKNKDTGQLAWISFVMAFAGNLARVWTTASQLSDPLTLASHTSAAVLNGTLLAQIFLYRSHKHKAH